MFDIGLLEVVLILVVGLIIIGPDRLPEVARALGKFFKMLRSVMNDIKATWEGIADTPDEEPKTNGRRKK